MSSAQEELYRRWSVVLGVPIAALRQVAERVREWDPLVMAAAIRHGVPVAVLQAIMHRESGGRVDAYNPERDNDLSIGLMQVRVSTARGLGYAGSVEGLYKPEENIARGAQLVRQLWDRYRGNLSDVLADYNGGPRMVTQRGPVGLYPNQPYVDGTTKLVAFYSQLPAIAGAGVGILVLILAAVWWWRKRWGS